MATNPEKNLMIKLVVGLFDAAPGKMNLTDLLNAIDGGMTFPQVADVLDSIAEFTYGIIDAKSDSEQVAEMMNHFGLAYNSGAPDPATAAGQAQIYFAARHAAGDAWGDIILDAVTFLSTTTNPLFADTVALLNNKALVAEIYSNTYNSPIIPDSPLNLISNVEYLQGVLEGVTATSPATQAEAEAHVQIYVIGEPTEEFTLTQQADNLVGNNLDNVFKAPVTQNETGSGALANTFDTGDVLDGAGGRNTLEADLIASGTIGGQNPAISATTSNIQEVYIRAQNTQGPSDNASNTTFVATVDAEKMSGVEQWWSNNSRADVRIEDIRSRPDEVAFGMRLTDPAVGYQAYFNPLFMTPVDENQFVLTLTIQEITGGVVNAAAQLEHIAVRELNFKSGGKEYTLSSDEMTAARTWDALEAAIQAQIDARSELKDQLIIKHKGDGVFEINDKNTDKGAAGFELQPGVEALILGVTENIDVRNRAEVGQIDLKEQTRTDIILDGAGSGSRGGSLNIAAMSGDRGVEVFDVMVDRTSHLTSLSSVNSPNTGGGRSFDSENQLEEVYLTHLSGGAMGDFFLGSRTQDSQGVSTTTDDRLQTNGLTDVRVFDATGFTGALKVGASLTNAILDKYLLGVTEPVQFSYLLSDGGSNLNLAVNNVVAGDPDFLLKIIGGLGDDRINLSGLAVKQNTTVDGGNANSFNTLEIDTSSGWAATQNGADIVAPAPTDLTAEQTSFASVTNINKLVIAGQNNTTHDVVKAGFGTVGDFVIATGNVDTRLVNLDAASQTVSVSGKNQTLGAGNNNNDQFIGTVRFSDTKGDTLDLTLENTARADGVLTVNQVLVDNTVGNVSEVRTLNIDSSGARDASNVITTLNGNLVNTFNLMGTQDLTITNLASASNSTAASASERDSLRVDGSSMEGDLYLGVSGAVITAVDAALGTDRTVTLIGTDGDADTLNIRDGVTTTNATTISGFETIRFGADGGIIAGATNFNATNVSGVGLYDLVDSAPAGTITLTNLRSTENVNINALNTDGTAIRADVTLATANPTAGSRVNVNFANNETTANFAGTFWQPGGANLNVQDFQAISLDMGGNAGNSYDYNFNLNTLPNPTTGNVNARTLEITGGRFDAGYTNVDSLTLNALDTALTRVDFSNYDGNFATSGWNSTQGSNAEVVVNEFGFRFDVGGNNTVFHVPASAGLPPVPAVPGVAEQQTIDFTGASPVAADGDLIFNGIINVSVLTTDTDAQIAAKVQAALAGADLFSTGNNVTAAVVGNVVTITAALADGNVAAIVVTDDAAAVPAAAPAVTDDAVAYVAPVPAIPGSVDTKEVQTLDFTGGFGDLASGESITITFAGGQYTFTNTTGAAILEADIDNAIIADAASAPQAFAIATGGGDLIQLTASAFGNMPDAVITASDVANTPVAVVVATTTPGDLIGTNVTGYDVVSVASEFLTKFVFTEDAFAQGVVWQIDNFQAFGAGSNVTIQNQTQLDLRALGVDSSAKITIEAGDVFLAGLDLAETAAYAAQGNAGLIGGLSATDTVITSNAGLDFTIVLTGVQSNDMSNENIVGIA